MFRFSFFQSRFGMVHGCSKRRGKWLERESRDLVAGEKLFYEKIRILSKSRFIYCFNLREIPTVVELKGLKSKRSS